MKNYYRQIVTFKKSLFVDYNLMWYVVWYITNVMVFRRDEIVIIIIHEQKETVQSRLVYHVILDLSLDLSFSSYTVNDARLR